MMMIVFALSSGWIISSLIENKKKHLTCGVGFGDLGPGIMKLSILFSEYMTPRDACWNELPLSEMRIWIALVGSIMWCGSGGG